MSRPDVVLPVDPVERDRLLEHLVDAGVLVVDGDAGELQIGLAKLRNLVRSCQPGERRHFQRAS